MGTDKTASGERVQAGFNSSLVIEPGVQPLSSDGGAVLLREIDEKLKIVGPLAERLFDPRDAKLCTYSLAELLRARLLLIAMGYQDQDDADALRHDPTFAAAVTDKKGPDAIERPLASQPTMSRLIDILSRHLNRRALRDALLDLAVRAFKFRRDHRYRYLTLDLDSTDIETFGHQQGAIYNGYYEHTCYHPLIATIDETGDLVGAWVRKGNASSPRGAVEFALPIVDRLQGEIGQVVDVRGDAAFAVPRFMDALDERGVNYVFRLRKNSRLQDLAAPHLVRPIGRPPLERRQWLHELTYQAESWTTARRVVLVVIDDPERRFMGQLDLDYFFLVTTHDAALMPADALLDHYRKRGTMETWIGEFKRDVAPRLSSPRLAENQATLALFALAYQWLHLARMFTDAVERRECRSTIGTFRLRLLKVAAVFIRSSRRVLMRTVEHAFTIWTAAVDRLRSRVEHVAAAAVASAPSVAPSASPPTGT